MKKIFTLVLLTFCMWYGAVAQDVISLKSGNDVKAKIIRLNPENVTFSLPDGSDTVIMPRNEINKLTYGNGTIVYLTDGKPVELDINQPHSSEYDSMYYVGVADATKYYTEYKPAATGTLVAALAFPYNLLPAIICSKTPPKDYNLGYRDKKLMENPGYHDGYTKQAFKIKKQKVWKNYGIGTGVYVGLYAALVILIASVSVY